MHIRHISVHDRSNIGHCDGAITIAHNIIDDGMDDVDHKQHLCKFIHFTYDYALMLNPEDSEIKTTFVTFWKCLKCTRCSP